MTSVKLYDIRANGEYAEFFVAEREPVPKDGGRMRYTVTWCCYSSFGTFGHHWYDMGGPFAEFIQGMDADYLLSKIARKVTSEKKCCRYVRDEILTARREGAITATVARDAWEAVEGIESEYSGLTCATMLYEDGDISAVPIEWCDVDSQEWDTSAVMFVKKLWPLFVTAVREQRAIATSTPVPV